ncbi:unnamed protein product [Cuscuta campestris]|uniref:CCHC-type domain-containing protein n=1 Tax=Cuscuta campestris TaxID=132261 RepID=A0A484LLF6_9ASTE|nr:unnamed protein product [Cuscuta campestris]
MGTETEFGWAGKDESGTRCGWFDGKTGQAVARDGEWDNHRSYNIDFVAQNWKRQNCSHVRLVHAEKQTIEGPLLPRATIGMRKLSNKGTARLQDEDSTRDGSATNFLHYTTLCRAVTRTCVSWTVAHKRGLFPEEQEQLKSLAVDHIMGDMEEGANVQRPPLLRGHNYNFWKGRMRAFLKSLGGGVWRSVETGWTEPRKYSEDLTTSTIKPFEEYSRTEAIAAEFNDKALNAIFGAVDSTQYKLISNCDNAKEAWDILEVTHEGDEEVKTAKYQILMTQYENLRMDDKEKIIEFHGRVRDIANQAARLNESIPENKLVLKVLRSLPKEYDMDVKAIRRSHNIKNMTLDALMGILESIELDMMEDSKRRKPDKQIAFSTTEAEDDSEHDLSLDEDFQEQLSLFTRQFKKQWMQKKGNQRMEGTSKGPFQKDTKPREVKYPENVTSVKKKGPQCFECGGYGHIQSEFANNLKKKRQSFTATWSDEEVDELGDHGEQNCAFIACENSDLEDSLAEQLEDLQEKWAELLMVNKRNVADKNRLLSEMEALKQKIEESKHKITKLEGENSNLRYEINQLKSYQKWIKVAGAEMLDHHSLMAKPPGDMTCIGFTNTGSTSKSQEIKFVKALERAPPEYQVKRSLLNGTHNDHYTSYRCYRCREWGHVKRQCIKEWSQQRIKRLRIKKELWARNSWPRLLAMKKEKQSDENQKSTTSCNEKEISPDHVLGNSEEHEDVEGKDDVEDDVLLRPVAEISGTLYLKHTPAQQINDMQMEEEDDPVQEKEIPDLVDEEPLIACSDVPFEDSQPTTPVIKKKQVKNSRYRWSLRQKAKEDQEAEKAEEIQARTSPEKGVKRKGKSKDELEECTKRLKRSPTTERLTTRSQSSKKKGANAEKLPKPGKFPNQVFTSSTASFFMSEIAKKSILPQRSIDVDDFETKTNLIPVLKQSHLLKSVTIPGSYVRRVIHEFYCNLNESCNTPSDPSFHKVFVRGKTYDLSPAKINKFLHTKSISSEKNVNERQVWTDLTNGERISQTSKSKVPSSILKSSYAILFRVAAYQWLPTTHMNTVPLCMDTLIYKVKHGIPFNLGKIIYDQILSFASERAKSNTNGLPYPLLIFQYLKSQGLNVADDEEPAPPLLQVDMRHFEGRHHNDMVMDESQRTATAFLGSDFSQTAFLRTEIQLLQEQIERHKELIKAAEVKKKKMAIILSSLDAKTGSTAQPQGEDSKEDTSEEDDATQGEQSEGNDNLADEDSDFEAELHKFDTTDD